MDHVLSAALNRSDVLSAVRYPVAYVDFLRACIERSVHLVTEVKGDAGAPERAANRFAMLLGRLRLGLPAIDFSATFQAEGNMRKRSCKAGDRCWVLAPQPRREG